MRTCLVVGCGRWAERDEDLCFGCQIRWLASGECRRAGFVLAAGRNAFERIELAACDWLRRIEAERRNGGQP